MTYPGSDQNQPEPSTAPVPPYSPIVPSQPSYVTPSYTPASAPVPTEPTAAEQTASSMPEPMSAPQPMATQPMATQPMATQQSAMPMYGAPGQPVPMAPTYDPNVAQPYSAPPVSAPYGYGAPMPMSGLPMAPPVEKRGKGAVITLSILTTLFVLGTGIMTTLFLQQRSEAQKANTQLTTLSGQLTDAKSRAEQLQRDVDNAQRDLTDAKSATDEITSQKKVIADCINGIYAYWDALDKANGAQTADVKKKLTAASDKCKAADKYL